MEVVARAEALDRGHLGAVRLGGEDRAALNGLAVQVHGAGAAVRGVAPDVRAGKSELVAQPVDEEESRLDLRVAPLTVDGGLHAYGRAHLLLPGSVSSLGRGCY